MADITLCQGTGCPLKEKCYRFTTPASEYRQSYFFLPPGKLVDDEFTCEMYWGEKSQSILNQLKDITDGKNNTGV